MTSKFDLFCSKSHSGFASRGVKKALMLSISRMNLSLRRFSLMRFSQQKSTKTSWDNNKSSKEQSQECVKEIENDFDVPKLYLEERIYANRNRKVRNIYITRALTEWKNDHTSGKNWAEVWTAPAPFDPHKVPLDIRMGAAQNMVPKPNKYGNLELMKLQNFLHLSPPTIKRHCEELKKFCTEWPLELSTDEECEREFPVEISTTDYVHAGQSQRNPRARITTLKIRLCNLALDHHARHKVIKLAGERYDPKTDILTIVADRCPVRKQNREYLDYLLTVLYYESWKTENWESRENIEDEDGIYLWKGSNSYKSLVEILHCHPKYSSLFADDEKSGVQPTKSLEEIPEVEAYRDAVCKIKLPDQNISDDERKATILAYKNSVRTLLDLPQL